jgi:hypothetical protein
MYSTGRAIPWQDSKIPRYHFAAGERRGACPTQVSGGIAMRQRGDNAMVESISGFNVQGWHCPFHPCRSNPSRINQRFQPCPRNPLCGKGREGEMRAAGLGCGKITAS